MTIAIGKPILASDIRNLIASVWPEDIAAFPIPSKGDPFDYLNQLGAYSEAIVALFFAHAPTSKSFDTGDPVLGVQSFSLVHHNSVDHTVEGTNIFTFTPQVGTKLLAPTSWDTATTGVGSGGVGVLGPLLQSSIGTVVGSRKILGCIVCTYQFVDAGFPGDGASAGTYTAYDAYLALR